MKYLKNFYIFILNLYLLSVAFSWVCFYLYVRVIRERNPVSFTEIPNNITFTRIIIIVIHLTIITVTLKYLYFSLILKKDIISGKITKIFLLLANWLYWKPLHYLHETIIAKIPYSGEIYFAIAKILEKFQPMQTTFIICAIIFNYLPRTIIVSCLIIDVFIFAKFYYFFISLGLFIIPMIYTIILFLLKDFYTINRPILNNIILAIEDNTKPFHYFFSRNEGYHNISNEDFEEYQVVWFTMFNLEIYVNAFKDYLYKYMPGINLFCSLSYIICWIYYAYTVLDFDAYITDLFIHYFSFNFLDLYHNFKLFFTNFITLFLEIYLYVEEPFSGLLIIEDLVKYSLF